jgi:ABC-2 type transport system ATP-binding protein
VKRLEARELTRVFGNGDGVHGISLDVEPGEVHALIGLNGAGKSTLMRLLLGMMTPQSGSVLIDGREKPDWRRVGQLVEYPLAYPELTVRQNLRLAGRLHGLNRIEAAAASDAIIEELALQRYADRGTARLSLGNRQRVGLASALQHESTFIVLDEPSNALDPSGVILLREALLRRANSGAGILVSSHHLDEVSRIATRITVMNAGRVIGNLDPAGIDLERSFFALVHAAEASNHVAGVTA